MTDILLLGATGFSGKLIAGYLYKHPHRSSPGFTFAVSGRSKSKLDALVSDLGFDEDVQVLTIDVSNVEATEAAIRKVKVVINAVGPYYKFCNHIVGACARHGVHYVDISGEPYFTLELIELYDYIANKNDVIIIPSSGFDSAPFDLLTYLSNKTLKSELGPDASIEDSVSSIDYNTGVSGGTVATFFSFLTDVPPHIRSLIEEPYMLSRSLKGSANPPSRLVYSLPYSSPASYGYRSLMCTINRAVVHRSWALFQGAANANAERASLAYGDKFRYNEIIKTPGIISAVVATLSIGFVTSLLLHFSAFRWLVKLFTPKQGEGTMVKNGYIHVTNVSTSNHHAVRSTMKANVEPYTFTACLASESALALLLNFHELPHRMVGGGGVLTPMTALGDVLIKRLSDQDQVKVTFSSEIVRNESN